MHFKKIFAMNFGPNQPTMIFKESVVNNKRIDL